MSNIGCCAGCGNIIDTDDCYYHIEDYNTMMAHPLCDDCQIIKTRLYARDRAEFMRKFDATIIARLVENHNAKDGN